MLTGDADKDFQTWIRLFGYEVHAGILALSRGDLFLVALARLAAAKYQAGAIGCASR